MTEPKGQYQLGEPLTEAKKMQRYIAIQNVTGEVRQNQFLTDQQATSPAWTYYADPRPLPVLPEPKLFKEWAGNYQLTAEGRRRLEQLLREEGES